MFLEMRHTLGLVFLTLTLLLLAACSQTTSKTEEEPVSGYTYSEVQLTSETRDVTVSEWHPKAGSKGRIFFSHGAASAPLKYEAIILPWVDQGYTVYAPLHVDSTDHPLTEKYQGFASWSARLEDARLVADYMNAETYIAAGHSYGALVALTLGGAQPVVPEEIAQAPQDERVALVLAYSPPGEIPNFVTKEAYSHLSTPALIQTGTMDVPTGTDLDYAVHLDAFYAASERGETYGLVLEGVDHYFGGAICRPELEGPKQLDQLEISNEMSRKMIAVYFDNDLSELVSFSDVLSSNLPTQFMRR